MSQAKLQSVFDPVKRSSVFKSVPDKLAGRPVVICRLGNPDGEVVAEASAIPACLEAFRENGGTRPYHCSVCRHTPCMQGLSGKAEPSGSGVPSLAHSIEGDGA